MIEKILSFADENEMFPESGALLACVSGGADSMCLLAALIEISAMRGYALSAAHYNHMLRGAESDRDEAFVTDYCKLRGVPLYVGRGDAADFAKSGRLGVEEAAREMRYGFFYAAAENIGAQRIVTAHTADDNAETMLMNLIRGAGANGLSGIPPVRSVNKGAGAAGGGAAITAAGTVAADAGKVDAAGVAATVAGTIAADAGAVDAAGVAAVRPMLRVSRREVLSFLEERGISFIEDSSNGLDVYTRNKVRHSIIPLITEINPKFIESASAAAELLRADNDYLSSLADDHIGHSAADAAELSGLPFAVSSRVIRKLSGVSLSYKHVKAVLDMCVCGGAHASLSLPGITARYEYGKLTFEKNAGTDVKHGLGDGSLSSAGSRRNAGSSGSGDHENPENPVCENRAGSSDRPDAFTPVWPVPGESIYIGSLNLKIICESVICNEPLAEADSRINKSFTSFLFKNDAVCGRITVRSRREGDKIRFPGRSGSKTLKKLFIELRIPARDRAYIPVVADEAGVLAVYGIGAADRAAPSAGGLAVKLTFERCAERNT